MLLSYNLLVWANFLKERGIPLKWKLCLKKIKTKHQKTNLQPAKARAFPSTGPVRAPTVSCNYCPTPPPCCTDRGSAAVLGFVLAYQSALRPFLFWQTCLLALATHWAHEAGEAGRAPLVHSREALQPASSKRGHSPTHSVTPTHHVGYYEAIDAPWSQDLPPARSPSHWNSAISTTWIQKGHRLAFCKGGLY